MTFSRKTFLAFALGVGVTLGGNALMGGAFAAQPYMDAALEQLRAARASLQQAEPNKGGHREAAIGLIDQAIEQVKAGIAFAR
ncbi:MAG: hypothetical protein AB1592_15085 [Pseudomonadota bacterium]